MHTRGALKGKDVMLFHPLWGTGSLGGTVLPALPQRSSGYRGENEKRGGLETLNPMCYTLITVRS